MYITERLHYPCVTFRDTSQSTHCYSRNTLFTTGTYYIFEELQMKHFRNLQQIQFLVVP
jgi:hypothetical protein